MIGLPGPPATWTAPPANNVRPFQLPPPARPWAPPPPATRAFPGGGVVGAGLLLLLLLLTETERLRQEAEQWNVRNSMPAEVPGGWTEGTERNFSPTNVPIEFTRVVVTSSFRNISCDDSSDAGFGGGGTSSSTALGGLGTGIRVGTSTAGRRYVRASEERTGPQFLSVSLLRAGAPPVTWEVGPIFARDNQGAWFTCSTPHQVSQQITGVRVNGQEVAPPAAPRQGEPGSRRNFRPTTAPPVVAPPLPLPPAPPGTNPERRERPMAPPPTVDPTTPDERPRVPPRPGPAPRPTAPPAPQPGPGPGPGVQPGQVPGPGVAPRPAPAGVPQIDPLTGQPRPNPGPAQQPQTPPGVRDYGPVVVGQPGSSPRPDLQGIATEVGRIEQKMAALLGRPQPEAPVVDFAPVLDALGQLAGLLLADNPGGVYIVRPPCGRGPDGGPLPPVEVPVPAAGDVFGAILARLDALAALVDEQKQLRGPVCKGKPAGEPVTVTFTEVG